MSHPHFVEGVHKYVYKSIAIAELELVFESHHIFCVVVMDELENIWTLIIYTINLGFIVRVHAISPDAVKATVGSFFNYFFSFVLSSFSFLF